MANGRITHCVDARPCLSHVLQPLILTIPVSQREKLRLRENKVTRLPRQSPGVSPGAMGSHALIIASERRLEGKQAVRRARQGWMAQGQCQRSAVLPGDVTVLLITPSETTKLAKHQGRSFETESVKRRPTISKEGPEGEREHSWDSPQESHAKVSPCCRAG